ncbi:transposase [Streptomyces sp. NBC_01020]|uniref:RNA-guided endonuclease InsQ/TnpB family protein n=1 Tax=unclassified Streptomyces TaxID=2593676 RepID=UPI002E1EA69C|nr:transposase [Streptomyces sp. NBC_01020]WSX71806.1 transposase [Streptomyces sp. NBC_00932]
MKMVTIARDGHQWWASFNVRIAVPAAARPTRRQQDAGMVGVDLGVAVIAATSEPVITANGNARGLPAHCQSAGWRGARDQVARLSGLVAQRRASSQHLLTKQLVTQFAHVALEDLRVKNMTRSARGTQDAPGRNVAAKAGLNRAILDVGFGEIRRQIEYKAERHGVQVTAVNPAYTSQTCHRCGHVDRKSRRTRSVFECTRCGHATHADIGAAHNIKHRALDTTTNQERGLTGRAGA